MLLSAGILFYLSLTVAIGLWASRRVRTAEDYIIAGRRLPFYLCTATVFATWFGAESLLGVSSEVAKDGLRGAIEDPLGAALCLMLVGGLFARPLYRMKLLTFGDLYRNRFGRRAETVAALCLVLSYFGWIAGQFVALGLLGEVVFGLPVSVGIGAGCAVVVAYTFWGGMWAIAWLDLIQNAVLIVGLILTVGYLAYSVQGQTPVRDLPTDYFRILPKANFSDMLAWFAALITIGLGSIPQQDVFQRVMAARSERVAVASSWAGGIMYLTLGLLPIVLAVLLRQYHPEVVGAAGTEAVDPQQGLPRYVLGHMPPVIGLFFVGALVSAVMSTCSSALLAPAAVLAENVFNPIMGGLSGKRLLLTTRLCVLLSAAISLALALSKRDIHELVSESSALSLVSLFVPMLAAIWKWRAGEWAALASMAAGMSVWAWATAVETATPALLWGLLASVLGLIVGMIWEQGGKRGGSR